MSRPHDGHHPFLPFGNPFKKILPKGSNLSLKLNGLQRCFELTLSERLKKLKPKQGSDILSLSWMRCAMESLSETHTAIESLITDLQFPVSDWDVQWMDMYLDSSVKLLDICTAFNSELSHLQQSQLLLRYILHSLVQFGDSPSQEKLQGSGGSLHQWMQQIKSRSPKLESSTSILQGLAGSLCLAKVKNSTKGKVLIRAIYGAKVVTIFVCSVITAALLGSPKLLMDLPVFENYLWAEAFNELQADVNGEIRKLSSCGKVIILKELEEVGHCVEELFSLTGCAGQVVGDELQRSAEINHKEESNSPDEQKVAIFQQCTSNLDENAERLADGLDHLSKQIGDFFQIVLTGRDALLCNLRTHGSLTERNRTKWH